MALTKPASRSARARHQPARNLLTSPWLLLAAAGAMLLVFGWNFIVNPTLSAPTRDPAWYTWRAELLTSAAPESIIREWGPYGMFSGGYRVTTPILGAWLTEVGGVSKYTFSILVMVAVPTLASLALAAFAYRHRRDPLLYLLTFFAGTALFLTIPYVGYMDNIICLYLLAMTLPFLREARTSWGARSAIALFMFLATLTHPTTTAIFAAVLVAGAGLHLLTSRFSITKTLDSDGPVLFSAGFGAVAGLAMWKIGAWGVQAPFADAALPPPYPLETFRAELGNWVVSLSPLVIGPLMAIAIGAIVVTALRRREPADDYDRFPLLWLLPLVGMFGFLLGLAYPYYRFMNTTLAPLILTGMGAWLAARFLLRRNRIAGIVAVVLILAGFASVLAGGMPSWTSQAKHSRFMTPDARVALASVAAYAEEEPDSPILFVNSYRKEMRAWGWGKTFANTARAGLDGDQAARSQVFFGDAEDLFADRPSAVGLDAADCEDIRTEDIYGCVSIGFYDEMKAGFAQFQQEPTAFVVRRFNENTPNEAAFDPSTELGAASTPLGPDVVVLTGPGLAPVGDEAVAAARAAGEDVAAEVADPPGRLADPLHLLRVVAALAFLLVVPGLIAMRWFQLEDFPVRLALVPGISLGLVLFSSFAVISVLRSPFGLFEGVLAAALAVGIAVVVNLLARRREAGRAVIMPFVRRSLSLFANRDFGNLMGAVFLAVLADGIVQGALAKTIAFGGQAGFSLEEARSPRDIFALVLLTYLPYMFVSPFVGVLIDRFDRRRLLMAANGIRAVVVGLVGMVLLGGSVPDALLIAALLLTLASTRLVLAIKSAGIPGVLDGRNLLQANSISQAGQAVSQLVGGGIALVGTGVASAGVVVIAGGVMYAVGTLFASRVRNLAETRQTTRFLEGARRILRNIVEGLGEVRRRPPAQLGVVSFLVLRTLFAYVLLVFALQARTLLGEESQLALLIPAGAGALGAALGFVAAQALKDRLAPARLMLGAMVGMGAAVIVFGGIRSVVGLSGIAFFAALTYFLGKIAADTIMQRALPDRYRGRGFSLFDVAYNLAWIVPAFVLFLAYTEARAGLLLIGAGVVFVAAALLIAGWAGRLGPQLGGTEGTARDEPEQEPAPAG
jgi:hypothetical protein